MHAAATARDSSGHRCWKRPGDLRRIVRALPAIRRRLLAGETTVIHGDMHPGNVFVRSGNPDGEVVLIDWARARIGSPYEDVASWLHSLGCWEPQARRRHDTLMRAYLGARMIRRAFDADARVDYALASACNGVSGAIRYHLAVRGDPTATAPARYDSGRALIAWQRAVRRAAALLSTSLDRWNVERSTQPGVGFRPGVPNQDDPCAHIQFRRAPSSAKAAGKGPWHPMGSGRPSTRNERSRIDGRDHARTTGISFRTEA
jgi:hypothetical protein